MADNNNPLQGLQDRFLNENTPVGKTFLSIKNYFGEMPKKKRNTVFGVAGGVVLLAAVLAIALNMTGDKYVPLYSGLEAEEANAIYQVLVADGIDVQLDSTGNVVVPKEVYDQCLLNLAAQGYPKTALTYDIFESSSGLTATESDRKQTLIHQTQNRLQDTLKRIDGVQDAVVTLSIPETSDYVWEQTAETDVTMASVLLTFYQDKTLEDGQITAIKNLVSSAVPKLEPVNVTVVDSGTGLELTTDEEEDTLSYDKNLEFQDIVQKRIEQNIRTILEPKYGKGGVVAVANVTINYDKMMTEKMELLPNEDDEGFLTHEEGTFQNNGVDNAGGVAGEENNTDIPDYTYNGGTALEGETLIEGLRDYDYGYIKTQIEKGNAILDRATVSVSVKQANLSETNREEITNIVSKSVDIDPENIYVTNFTGSADEIEVPTEPVTIFDKLQEVLPMWAIITIFAVAVTLVLLLILIPIIIIRKKRKKKKKDGMEEYLQKIEDERAAEQLELQQEIDRYKKELADIAMGDSNPKDEAILKEVKNFAKTNPKITANLLRSWIKEGDD